MTTFYQVPSPSNEELEPAQQEQEQYDNDHVILQGDHRPPATTLDLSDPDAPFIGWPLKRTCDEVEEWIPGVVFLCDNNFGGVGNMRNFMLTCVRYAIEAGASGLVMPQIRKRKDDDIKAIFGGSEFRPFGYLFDEENFRAAMGENCPQMTIYDDWTDVPNVRSIEVGLDDDDDDNDDDDETERKVTMRGPEAEELDPRQLSRVDGDRCDFAELDHQSDRFGIRFREHIRNPDKGAPPSPAHPRLFRGNDWPGVLWEWPVIRDGPEFANTFGGLCKFNKTIIQLGKKTLAAMQTFARGYASTRPLSDSKQNVDQDDDDRSNGAPYYNNNNNPKDRVAFSATPFMGIHLRSEADAEAFWPSYEEQETGYLRKAKELGFGIAYVASGDLNETHKLAAAAREKLGMTLVSKSDLLQGDDLAQLQSMSWDQQGLVDYIVLAGADYFTGNGRSSFSISLAQKRHLKAEGLYTRPYKVRPNGYGRSFIVGPMERYYEHWLFIWDAMWP
ncbi:hypothetical protein BD289DRAFT_462853 [Coniella lustricola]|uniref:Alternative oxidase n=1 Tax=Coniella lustricola TaxID=2025994 RepID=A0A2T2ZYN9_9PEZI|nr:hypothetical protein BD289DRAFT_462853 [Coniella lustricola]